MFRLAFFILIALEITGFVLVGGALGVLGTLLAVLLTGVLGVLILRSEALLLIRKVAGDGQRVTSAEDLARITGRDVGPSLLTLLGGVLLIIPGFATDILGLIIALPGLQNLVWGLFAPKVKVQARADGQAAREAAQNMGVVDLDADEWKSSDTKTSDRSSNPPSGWTQNP